MIFKSSSIFQKSKCSKEMIKRSNNCSALSWGQASGYSRLPDGCLCACDQKDQKVTGGEVQATACGRTHAAGCLPWAFNAVTLLTTQSTVLGLII